MIMRISLKQNKPFIMLAMSLVLGIINIFMAPFLIKNLTGIAMRPAEVKVPPVEIILSAAFLVCALVCILALSVCLAARRAAFSEILKIYAAYCAAVLVLTVINGFAAALVYRCFYRIVTIDTIKEIINCVITVETLLVTPFPAAAFWNVMYGKNRNNGDKSGKVSFACLNISFVTYIRLLILFMLLYVFGHVVTTALHSDSPVAASYMVQIFGENSDAYTYYENVPVYKVFIYDVCKTVIYTASGMVGLVVSERIYLKSQEDFIYLFKFNTKKRNRIIAAVLCSAACVLILFSLNTGVSDEKYTELKKDIFLYGAGQSTVKMLSFGNISEAPYLSDYLYHTWDLYLRQ